MAVSTSGQPSRDPVAVRSRTPFNGSWSDDNVQAAADVLLVVSAGVVLEAPVVHLWCVAVCTCEEV
ncbi:uncharacterized protein ColSpa_05264 [Colletotrichum spaethianum]|uniref:Uncharacterized protein n=1 Tax=Colletotrichum spaethianum TaxID=700344 RepID=A0AA37P1N0_9PEZI|nr:uncharacterized protein ColSpa_05264 [Colletotrichum spaethianum]GKT45083.1 hypothetical protein ColSpa_05264 [Colletotrichum spaethianum]